MIITERHQRRHTYRKRLAAATGLGAMSIAAIPSSAVEHTPTLQVLDASSTVEPRPPAEVSRSYERPSLRHHRHHPYRHRRGLPDVWQRLAQCEASGDPATNTGNGYYGDFQEDMTFWRSYHGLVYATRPDLATAEQQLVVARRGLAAQGPAAWPVCGPRVGLERGD